MSQHDNNIENLFRDSFENFEADVDPGVWNNIQQNISAPSIQPSGSSSGSWFGTLGAKIIIGTAATAVIGVIAISLLNNDDEPETQTSPVTRSIEEPLAEEVEATSAEGTPLTEHTSNIQENTPAFVTEQDNQATNNSDLSEKAGQSSSTKPQETTGHNIAPGDVVPGAEPSEHAATAVEELTKKEADSIVAKLRYHQLKEPLAVIYSAPIKGYAPLVVDFENHGYADESTWTFNDGTTESGDITEYTFYEPGIYTVTLTAKKGSEIKTDEVTIEVLKNGFHEHTTGSKLNDVEMIFTPNADGMNDKLVFGGKKLVEMMVLIFDRAGQKVGESNDIEYSWDGRDRFGSNAPEGTYFYVVRAQGEDGSLFEDKGSVTLVR